MSDKLTLEQQREALKAKIAKLEAETAELERQLEEAGKPWKPSMEYYYYYADPVRAKHYDYRQNTGSPTDRQNIQANNCYRTAEEAAEAGKQMYYRAWAESLSDVTEEMWHDKDLNKYISIWDAGCNKFNVDCWHWCSYGTPSYSSIETLRAAIATIGEDNWVRYVLGVQR